MNDALILTQDMPLFHVFNWMIEERRMVFLAGLPGVGKTLLLQQLALMAQDNGRIVHTISWDSARSVFETPEILRQYPEIHDVTHPAIRKAVGLWARDGIVQWHTDYPEPEHLLIGIVPLICNRLTELVKPRTDMAEPLLSSNQTVFAIPTPTRDVRTVIEAARLRSIVQPREEVEQKDNSLNAAQPVLDDLWREVYVLAGKLGLISPEEVDHTPYEPSVYAGVYQHLLRHRHAQVLPLDTVLVPRKSAYELEIKGTELQASPEAVERIIGRIQAVFTHDQLLKSTEDWYML